MSREVMRQALEALEHSHAREPIWKTPYREAVAALRDALGAPEPEPVFDCPRCGHCCPQTDDDVAKAKLNKEPQMKDFKFPDMPDSPLMAKDMALRDHFAAMAMQGHIARSGTPALSMQDISTFYEVADAMMKARESK